MLVALGWIVHAVAAEGVEAPTVSARAHPSSAFVGQAIEVVVEVASAGADAVVLAPTGPDFEIEAKGPSRPSGGPKRDWRFMAIARKPGNLEIGPFRARSGGRNVSSRPIRIAVRGLPAAGRTAAFLGGVGAFELRAGATPSTLVAGGTLEYRIDLTGPAARGSSRGPDLAAWATIEGARVGPVREGERGSDPPSRSYRYSIRVTRAGNLTLPPVAVSAFDPRTGHYLTRTTVSVPIVVTPPPRFDPSSVRYGEGPTRSRARAWRPLIAILGLAGVGAMGLAVRALARRRSRRAEGARRFAAELADRLDPSKEPADLAGEITSGLAELLRRATGRPPGVLTPPEAGMALVRLTGDGTIARAAEVLIERCDRAIYGGGSGPASAGLASEARAILEAIGVGLPGRSKSKGGGRRPAP